ncbi:dUTP diphosphatase [Alkalihalobacillus sp. AL-G]|uniref:dUTP diphosphatase n=1 Tax=Alkalihalobacillus sp. AL-G TaxID=2926399 RepID=UPI00272CBEED|nr:dUTP diphosphatase [Alkalihalobacillus sp. AL-G]WLD92324.1 dUTP diphosphatase [Alkalihalobacillus sp. AL-G]
MELNLMPFYKMQDELDRRIEKEHQLESKDLFSEKILALLVEVGELANETRCFKFWSSKPPSSKAVILEEFVDGLHFVLSIGLTKSYNLPEAIPIEQPEKEIVQAFLAVYEDIQLLKMNEHDVNKYERLLEDYLMIGRILGFTADDIQDAYLSKNEVNHSRQDQGY